MGVYTTQMDCVRTWLSKIHTDATVNHADEIGDIHKILDATNQKMFVNIPEPMGSDGDTSYWKRYKIEIHETSEANLNTAIDNILIGILKFKRRTAVTGFLYASAPTMHHVKYVNGDEAEKIRGIWKCNIYIDVEWGTS